jgi:hypothetical protein
MPNVLNEKAVLKDRTESNSVVEFGKGNMAFFAKQRALGLVGRAQLRHTVELTATLNSHSPFISEAKISVRPTNNEASVRMLCANCMKEEEVARAFPMCGRCRVVYYCNATCQNEHWMTHKKFCHRV